MVELIISCDEVFRIVCNIRTPDANGKESIGTGSFIVKANQIILLTAAHVAETTNKNTYLALGN